MQKQIKYCIFCSFLWATCAFSAETNKNNEQKPEEPTAPGSVMREEFTPGSWTLAILPDTQHYSQSYPGLFLMQTSWLAQNRDRFNIAFTLHLGDITNRNTPQEWQNAQNAMKILDGVIPYALATGNHDYEGKNTPNYNTGINGYFLPSKAEEQPTFGGMKEPGHLENTYHLFEAGGCSWIVISLEWAPRDEMVEWANAIMSKHPDRFGILITHAYLYFDNQRYDHTKGHQAWNPYKSDAPGTKNDGQELWDKLVRKHNFVFVFNGHVLRDGTGYRADKNDAGKTVHQVLSNFQMRPLGGEGYMRLMEFLPDGKTVKIRSYSPLYDKLLIQNDQQFTIALDE
ncbi:MAG: metallophosphoesterase [Sedimentisphaerales bacterium]|nr:metallophosphoesterase [Sedimentisphaerales bacterium]